MATSLCPAQAQHPSWWNCRVPTPPTLCWPWGLSLFPAEQPGRGPHPGHQPRVLGCHRCHKELFARAVVQTTPSLTTLSPAQGSFHMSSAGATGGSGCPRVCSQPSHDHSSLQFTPGIANAFKTLRIRCILEGGLAQRNTWTKPLWLLPFSMFPAKCMQKGEARARAKTFCAGVSTVGVGKWMG